MPDPPGSHHPTTALGTGDTVETPFARTASSGTGHVRQWASVGLSVIVALGCAHGASAAVAPSSLTETAVPPVDASNPDLVGGCGIDVALVLDASSSISDAGAVDVVTSAAQAYLDSLAETGSRVAVVNFKSSATVPIGYEPVTAASIAPGGRHWAAVHSTDPMSDSYLAVASTWSGRRTNWDAALEAVHRVGTPRLVVLVTDGVPTSYDDPAGNVVDVPDTVQGVELAAEEARTSAGALRSAGSHLLAVAVGAISGEVTGHNYRHDPPLGMTLLERLVGETSATAGFFFDAGAEADATFEPASDDVVVVGDFALLGSRLRELATSQCLGPSVAADVSMETLPDTGIALGPQIIAALLLLLLGATLCRGARPRLEPRPNAARDSSSASFRSGTRSRRPLDSSIEPLSITTSEPGCPPLSGRKRRQWTGHELPSSSDAQESALVPGSELELTHWRKECSVFAEQPVAWVRAPSSGAPTGGR